MGHNCFLQGKLGEYVYICSRCGACYACRHKAVYFDNEDQWFWKCKNAKFRPVIFDAKKMGTDPIRQEQRPEHSCIINKCLLTEDECKVLSFLGTIPNTQ